MQAEDRTVQEMSSATERSVRGTVSYNPRHRPLVICGFLTPLPFTFFCVSVSMYLSVCLSVCLPNEDTSCIWLLFPKNDRLVSL